MKTKVWWRAFLVALAMLAVLPLGAAVAGEGCQSKRCEARVRAHAFAEAHGGCRSVRCVVRVRGNRWKHLAARLGAGERAMLRRLRGCETRGIPFPANYRWKGHHRGAYQYDFATWAQAGGWGDPADASPEEQDVRTARFYPGHRGQWQCRA